VAERQVVTGVVSKAFGIRGDTYVHPDPDIADAFPVGRTYTVTAPGREDAPPSLTVAASRLHSGRRVVRFEGVEDRTAAEALRGLVLSLAAGDVPLADDAVWADEVVGHEVVDGEGAVVGIVEATLDGPAHDYLVVARTDGGEVLIPAVEALVRIEAERVVVQAIPGLLDPDMEE
jgi:16S rRNA processing protein RimM